MRSDSVQSLSGLIGRAVERYTSTSPLRSTFLYSSPRFTAVQTIDKSSAVAEMGDRGVTTIDMGKNWVAVCPFSGGLAPIEHKVAWAEAYVNTKWHLSPSSRLATTDIGRKLGGCAPLGRVILVPI